MSANLSHQPTHLSQICIYNLSGQMHFRDVFIEDIRHTFRLMLPLSPLLLRANFMTHPGQGSVGTRGYASGSPPKIGWRL